MPDYQALSAYQDALLPVLCISVRILFLLIQVLHDIHRVRRIHMPDYQAIPAYRDALLPVLCYSVHMLSLLTQALVDARQVRRIHLPNCSALSASWDAPLLTPCISIHMLSLLTQVLFDARQVHCIHMPNCQVLLASWDAPLPALYYSSDILSHLCRKQCYTVRYCSMQQQDYAKLQAYAHLFRHKHFRTAQRFSLPSKVTCGNQVQHLCQRYTYHKVFPSPR